MPKKPTAFQERAATRAMRNYAAGGGDQTDFRRSTNKNFDPVTVYPGKSTVGGRNIGLQTTPMEKLANANEITKRKRRT